MLSLNFLVQNKCKLVGNHSEFRVLQFQKITSELTMKFTVY